MATYAELFDLRTNSPLLNKVTVAIAIKCKAVLDDGGATSGQKDWAREGIKNPRGLSGGVINQVLVTNKDVSKAQIESATDTAIQSAVDTAITDLISGLV